MKIVEELKKENNIPVVMADQNGVIFYINSKFEDVFLWAKNEIVGKHITTIIPKDLHDAHNLGFSRFLATEKSTILNQSLNLAAEKKNGVIFSAEHVIHAEKNDGAWIFCATIRPTDDVSTTTELEEELIDAK